MLKKILLFALTLTMVLSILVSCSDDGDTEQETVYHTVSFNTNCNENINDKRVAHNTTVGKPTSPQKEGYIFGGWSNNGRPWDFQYSTVKEDITLDAVWLMPDTVFKYETMGDGNAKITGKKKDVECYTIPAAINGYTVTTIGTEAFKSLSSEETIKLIIPQSVTTIEESAFERAIGIEIVIEGKLKNVGERAFYLCEKLKAVQFAEDAERIAFESFSGCISLSSVVIPKSITTIEESAFNGCIALRSVVLHSELASVEHMAFDGTSIQALYVYGTDQEIDTLLSLRVDGQNNKFIDADVYVYSETEPEGDTVFEGFWYYDSNGQIRLWK